VTVEELLEGKLLKTAEDAQGAGRIMARAYADEMERLAGLFGIKEAEDDDEKKKRFERFKKKDGKGKDDCPPSSKKKDGKDGKDEDEKNSFDLDAMKKILEGK